MSLLIPAIDLITVGTLSDNAINHNVEKLFSLIGLNPTLLAILTLLVLLIFFSSLFILTKELLLTKFSLQLLMRVRKDIYHHLVNAPWLYLINCQKSEFSYYLIEESAQIPNAYFQLCNLMAFIGTALVYASLCFYINIEMSAIIMVAMACSHLLFHRKIKRSTDHGKKHQLINRAYATTIVEHFDAINLIKSSVSEDVCERDIGNILDKMKAIRYEGKYHGILITVFSAPVMIAILCGVLYLSTQLLTIEFSSTLIIVALFYRMAPKITGIQSIYYALGIIAPAVFAVDRFNQLAYNATAKEQLENRGSQKLPVMSGGHKVELDNLCFKYHEKNEYLLNEINLTIQPNQYIGIAGASGSGKSTLLILMLGLVMPNKGQIRIDDISLSELHRQSWFKRIGYVSQETILVNDTIKANIAWGKSGLTHDQIVEATKLARLYDFIMSLPEQFDTNVGDRGGLLSGGQKQRLALARAIVHKPAVLFLDEATNALDMETEREIMSMLKILSAQMAIINVSHKLSTMKDTDFIYVMDNGSIIDQGTWDQMIAKKEGLFYRMLYGS